MAAGSDIPARAASRGVDYVFGYAPAPPAARSIASADQPLISTKAQFSYGVHVGARPKQTPEYIGATNRANRRRARLDEQDEPDRGGRRRRSEGSRSRPTVPPPSTRTSAAPAASCPTPGRSRRQPRPRAPRPRCSPGHGRTRRPRAPPSTAPSRRPTREPASSAGRRRAPPADRLRRRRCHRQSRRRVRERGIRPAQGAGYPGTRGRGPGRAERGRRTPAPRARGAGDRPRGSRARSRPPSMRSSAPWRRRCRRTFSAFSSRSARPSATSRRPRTPTRATTDEPGSEHDKVTAADRDLHNERQSLADAIGQLFDQAGAFGEFARPDLRPLLGVTTARAWPDPAAWPDPGRASDELADVLAAEQGQPPSRPAPTRAAGPADPGAAVRAVLPAAATEILDAFAAATRGGRQVTEGALKNTADRMSVALKDFTDALAACEEDYRVDWEPGGAVGHRARHRRRGPQAGGQLRDAESTSAPRTRESCSRTGSARSSRTSCWPRWPGRSTRGSSPPAT